MQCTLKVRSLITLPLSMLLASNAVAQDLLDVQPMVDRLLFTGQAVVAQQKAAERQRLERLDQRVQQQAMALHEQTSTVQQLSNELQMMRDERQLLGLSEAFDAAIVSRRWATARALLADSLTIELPGFASSGSSPMSADIFIADLAKALAGGGVLPRSNEYVRIGGERAILHSQGHVWRRSGMPAVRVDQNLGRYEYHFHRGLDGWKIDGLVFRSATPSAEDGS